MPETHVLYGGLVELEYDDPSHEYRYNGQVVPNVTSITGIKNKPFLIPWALKVAGQYVLDNWPEEPSEVPTRMALVKGMKKAHEKVRDAAAGYGKEAHEWIEHYIHASLSLGEPPPMPVTPQVLSAVQAFLAWEREHRVHYLASERKIFSLAHVYAGTLDIMAEVDGVVTLLDLKGFPVETKIPTPSGWSTVGDIEVGATVFDRNGGVCEVVAKNEKAFRECYELSFDDGSRIICDEDHLWPVICWESLRKEHRTPGPKGGEKQFYATEKALTPTEINKRLSLVQARGRCFISLPDPVWMEPIELPIDPYVLGLWLGDGATSGNVITSCDHTVFDECARRGYPAFERASEKHLLTQTRSLKNLRSELTAIGLLGQKRIPECYLRSSIQQRLDLLRGLMDSDGTYNKGRRTCVFYSTDNELARGVDQLVLTLGERPRFTPYKYTGFGKEGMAFRVEWRPRNFVPFWLQRKAEQVSLSPGNSWRRQIKSVVPVGKMLTQCIAVNSEDNCFLVGETWLPTHNTSNSYREDYALQTAAYIMAHNEEHGDSVENRIVLMLHKETAQFNPVVLHPNRYERDADGFLGARRLWQWDHDEQKLGKKWQA